MKVSDDVRCDEKDKLELVQDPSPAYSTHGIFQQKWPPTKADAIQKKAKRVLFITLYLTLERYR